MIESRCYDGVCRQKGTGGQGFFATVSFFLSILAPSRELEGLVRAIEEATSALPWASSPAKARCPS
jgi:hypothetical protein